MSSVRACVRAQLCLAAPPTCLRSVPVCQELGENFNCVKTNFICETPFNDCDFIASSSPAPNYANYSSFSL